MRTLLFLSRFTFICNIAFLLFAFFRWLENSSHASGSADVISRVPFLKELIILLGFCAIFINIIMCVVYIILMAMRKKELPWVFICTNFLFLIIQIIYFFYY
jgi:ABC-type bacteriocin/lantibiotic exporter with double-glycine peptidase domain